MTLRKRVDVLEEVLHGIELTLFDVAGALEQMPKLSFLHQQIIGALKEITNALGDKTDGR